MASRFNRLEACNPDNHSLTSISERKISDYSSTSSLNPTRWFLFFIYDKEKSTLLHPTLYEEDEEGSYKIARQCSFLPEMLGLVEEIEEARLRVLQNREAQTHIISYASQPNNLQPSFLFDFEGNLLTSLPVRYKKIKL